MIIESFNYYYYFEKKRAKVATRPTSTEAAVTSASITRS
jgi:hypothetical protein